jgi:hypothetical protein
MNYSLPLIIATILSLTFIVSLYMGAFFKAQSQLKKSIKNNTMQNTATQQEIKELIEATKGRFFSLTFEKKDGSIRTINAKDRFTSLVKGTGSPATDALKQEGYMFAVNRNNGRFVSFKPEKVKHFKCGSIEKQFSDVVV